jgi:hypothetical protein
MPKKFIRLIEDPYIIKTPRERRRNAGKKTVSHKTGEEQHMESLPSSQRESISIATGGAVRQLLGHLAEKREGGYWVSTAVF